jgi:hypothetical protein
MSNLNEWLFTNLHNLVLAEEKQTMAKLYVLKINSDGFYNGDILIKVNDSYHRPYTIDYIDGVKVAKYPGHKLPDKLVRYLDEIELINNIEPNLDLLD